jgi:hypothetical protein
LPLTGGSVARPVSTGLDARRDVEAIHICRQDCTLVSGARNVCFGGDNVLDTALEHPIRKTT